MRRHEWGWLRGRGAGLASTFLPITTHVACSQILLVHPLKHLICVYRPGVDYGQYSYAAHVHIRFHGPRVGAQTSVAELRQTREFQ